MKNASQRSAPQELFSLRFSTTKKVITFLCLVLIVAFAAWFPYPLFASYHETPAHLPAHTKAIVQGTKQQLGKTLFYDPSYVKLKYPNGDVPLVKGVCTDVVIRALRNTNIDLQKEVHEDMRRAFGKYPKNWGLKRADKNIDHRRVPNLQTFFKRKGWQQPITKNAQDYLPGDIVSWKFDNGLDHIGVVVSSKSLKGIPLIVHNSGMGAQMEDVLFEWKITGHYRVKRN